MSRPAPPAVARVGGLPAAALHGLACPEATRLAGRVVHLTEELTRRAAVLSDALYEVIGATGARKPILVAIRRDLHGLRRPKRVEVLPAPLAELVRTWISLWEERARVRAVLPDVLAREERSAWSALRELAATPAVRHGLAHASPDLSAGLERWLADPGWRPRPSTLASLLRYVTRVAAKTSPFSTFTTVHEVRWVDGGVAWQVPDTAPTVVVEADVGLRLLVESVLPRTPEVAAARVVRLSPAAYASGDRLTFPEPGGRMRAVDRTSALDTLVELLRGEQRWDAAIAKLTGAGLAGDGADDGTRDGASDGAAAAEQVLSGLVRGGLVEAVVPVPGQAARPFARLADWAAPAPPAGPLHRIQVALDQAGPLGDGDPSASACAHVARRLTAELPALGLPVMPVPDLRRRVLRESALGPPVACALPEWRPALADLRRVRRWLAVHDPMLPLRLTLADRVRDWFGPGSAAPLLDVYARVRTAEPGTPLDPDFLEHPDPLAGATDPCLTRLRELRAASVAALTGGRAEEALSEPPAWVRDPGPVTCYVQPFQGQDGLRLVLNAAHGGHGRGITRWTRLLGAEPAPAPPPGGPPAAESPPGELPPGACLVAELPGTFGHSLNLHAPGIGWELTYPGAVNQTPPERRVPLAELQVRHDAGRGVVELWWPRAGRRVVPVHAGMMSETLLPPLARLLVEAFGTTHLTHPTLPAVARAAGPRIDLGRVTLARAQWTVRREEIPRRGGDDAAHLVAVHAWLRAAGVPRRCFVRVREPQVRRDRLAFDKRHKPVFVDFGSWPSVLEFDRIVTRAAGDLELTEALPDSEWAVELAIEIGAR
ncbi:lantibiotic dehydratase [Nonomuraea pusilla]|uniref:Lantibiotic dehydratase, C terminus n=1 Tax=Nonomuraea pusilla TaxID=46177 RepID=A0A1H7UBA8_9ACTN|nr:lantibiotic dehydratase [Nonomuraea pusilla]SEL93587.1 Lantibiotic dehydratase, C terminus [Nonomuraea pusilla]